jgi:primosomal protein N' (replication factor Y) (superfamily II helicase)
VGVVLADTTLNLADFRAAERTFQLLTQVSGRAGRGDLPGKVIVQTFHPNHYAVALAAAHDFEAFAAREIESRRDLFYPPYSRLVNVRIHGIEKSVVERAAMEVRDRLDEALKGRTDARVVGPAPAPLSMIRGRHRWQVMIRAGAGATARWAGRAALSVVEGKKGDSLRVELDVDPQSLL